MRGIMVLARREIVRGRRAWIAAGVLGFLPVIVAAAPLGLGAPAETRATFALLLAVAVGTSHALVLGASLFGPDLVAGRMGFDLVRPLSAAAMWLGRVFGAWVLAAVGVALVAAPALVVGADPRGFGGRLPGGVAGVALAAALAILFLIGAAHAASLALRSRSPRLAFDLVALAVFVGLVAAAVLRLAFAGARELFGVPEAIVLGLVVVAPFVAGGVSLARGRADLVRCHAVSSMVLWCALLPAGIGLELRSRAIVAVALEDVDYVAPCGACGEDWVVLYGYRTDRIGLHTMFLVESRTGRWARLADAVNHPTFSHDRRIAAWMATLGPMGGGAVEVCTVALDAGELSPRRTGVRYETDEVSIALSPDGALVAAIDPHRILVHEVATGRAVTAAWVSERATRHVFVAFVGSSHVRVWRWIPAAERVGDPTLEISELDLATGRLERTGTIPPGRGGAAQRHSLRLDLASGRMLTGSGGAPIRDARSGAVLTELSMPAGAPQGYWHHLQASGRVLVGSEDGALHVFDERGAHLRRIELGGRPGTTVSGIEDGSGPDEVVVGLWCQAAPTDTVLEAVAVVDVATGTYRELGTDLEIGVRGWGPRHVSAAPATAALVRRGDAAVLAIDLRTGVERPIWPRPR